MCVCVLYKALIPIIVRTFMIYWFIIEEWGLDCWYLMRVEKDFVLKEDMFEWLYFYLSCPKKEKKKKNDFCIRWLSFSQCSR